MILLCRLEETVMWREGSKEVYDNDRMNALSRVEELRSQIYG